MEHHVGVRRRCLGHGERGAERLDRASAAVVDVDDGDGRPRDADGKARDEQTYNSGADDDDAVGGSAARIPMRVEGRLHRGRERRAARRHGFGDRDQHVEGATKRSWCGCRQNTVRPTSAAGPAITVPVAQ